MDGAKATTGGKPAAKAARSPGSTTGDGSASAAPSFAAANEVPGDEVDDEQVERFYALLANIQALRRVYTPGGDTDDGCACETAAADGGSPPRKRLRGGTQPPWRPAFRLEDFEDVAATPTSKRAAKTKESPAPADGDEKPAQRSHDGPAATARASHRT